MFGMKLFQPFHHYLAVAQLAERPEELASAVAHLLPIGVRVDFLNSGSDGAAAAQSDTNVVDRVSGGIRTELGEFFQRSLHPEREVAMLGRSTRGESDSVRHFFESR